MAKKEPLPSVKGMTAEQLVTHVIQNWRRITGTPKSAMQDESEFPEAVEALMEEAGVSYDGFQESWTLSFG